MGRIVGIDLGTTYSAVAVPEPRTGDGFLAVRGCPGCAVILDRFKRPITPSVVAEDDAGKILVGHAAKGRAGLSPEPVMFSKRWMGEDKTFALRRQGTLTPVDAAAHILRYLKELAEWRLGEPVDEAVVTVPAYFSLLARQMTEKAAGIAGLRVAQIAQEPVAAALMYSVGDTRPDLRLMTYDLGGGTFDVAILEKRDGVIGTDSIRAFDGNRFLGGYNFDRRLAHHLLDRLNAEGYDLPLDPESPADRVPWAKLMVYAERAKIELSKAETAGIQEPTTGITDRAGNPVAINLEVSRDDFEALIRAEVEDTIRLCHQAREKADPPVKVGEFDEILMVGGSSRVPLVARRLEEEFGRKPRLIEPDLCVALGAAILAGTKGRSYGRLRLDPVPEETDLPTLAVTGKVDPAGGPPAAVTLRAADGSFLNTLTTKPDGAFAFPQVPLRAEAVTEFALTASAGGAEVAAHKFAVRRSAAGRGGLVEAVTNVLSKPIKIRLVDADHTIAPVRTPLPFQVPLIRTRTTDTSGVIRIPVLEDNTPLGDIVLTDVPTDLPVGTAVELGLTIEENWQVRGRAAVPAINREQPVCIELPVPKTPSVQELEGRYADLERRAGDAQTGLSTAARFEKAKLIRQVKERLAAARAMLDDRTKPEPAAVNDVLDEVEGLVRQLAAGWKPDPPRAVFEDRERDAADLEAKLVAQKPAAADDGYDKRRESIKKEADKAYAAQNSAAWADAYQKLDRLCGELEQRVQSSLPPPPPCPPQNPATVMMGLRQTLTRLRQTAEAKDRYKGLKDEFKAAEDGLDAIDPRAADAIPRINDWYFSRFEPLRKKVEGGAAPAPPDGLTKMDPAAGGKP